GVGLLQPSFPGELRRVHRGQAGNPADPETRRGCHRPDEGTAHPGALRLQLLQPEPDPAGGGEDWSDPGSGTREYRRRAGCRHLLRSDEHLDQRPRRWIPQGSFLMDALIHSLWLAPLVACMAIVAIHSYLGVHVIAREVIFVDLSLAQVAALGSTIAIFLGAEPDSAKAFAYALGFTTAGAAMFALTRSKHGHGRVPQEAIIGIVYVVASAAGLLVADKSPRGGEAIKDILVGSLLWVGWPAIGRLAAVYAVVGLFHWILRRRFLTISFDPEAAEREGWKLRLWDFWFY